MLFQYDIYINHTADSPVDCYDNAGIPLILGVKHSALCNLQSPVNLPDTHARPYAEGYHLVPAGIALAVKNIVNIVYADIATADNIVNLDIVLSNIRVNVVREGTGPAGGISAYELLRLGL